MSNSDKSLNQQIFRQISIHTPATMEEIEEVFKKVLSIDDTIHVINQSIALGISPFDYINERGTIKVVKKTLRDEFAMAALTSIYRKYGTIESTVSESYKIADAMLEERSKKKK